MYTSAVASTGKLGTEGGSDFLQEATAKITIKEKRMPFFKITGSKDDKVLV